VVLISNAFWWLPGVWLAATKGASGFAFAHPEGVGQRLWQVVTTEAPVERALWVLGAVGFVALWGRGRVGAAALTAFVGSGFAWGYLAGGLRALDFLQPGRHTYACYSGLTVAAGVGVAKVLNRLRGRARLDLMIALALACGLGGWIGPSLVDSVRARVGGPVPFLSSRPSPRLLWVVSRVRRHVAKGERLLYEEGGFGIPGLTDPYQGGRFSGLLPGRLGVEVIGGPYLHAALTTNYTQFGEGKLFGRADWDRDWFVRHARLYRPSAVLCWTPRSRAFCRANPDLIDIKDDDGALLIGRVRGFGGDAVEGRATVEAVPGRLRVRGLAGGVDGSVVLRYHSVPGLRADPPVGWGPVRLEDDPVPFIKLRPPLRAVDFTLKTPPGRAGGPSR